MAQSQATANSGGLRARILSALVMIPAAVAIIWIGREAFLFFLIALGCLMSWEWSRISNAKSKSAWVMMAAFIGASLIIAGLNLGLLAILLLLMFGAFLVMRLEAYSVIQGCRLLMFGGTIYIGTALLAASWLRMQEDGMLLFLWLVSMVVATDIGAYVAGRTIGGIKLAPAISPNKTWAGLFGGMAAAAVISGLFANYRDNIIIDAIFLGLILAAVAQSGDLLESWLKRRSGHKDSSRLIPGHGGILDRMDGFLAATPIFAFYIYYVSFLA